MKIGFLDFEATGVEPKKANIIEYAFWIHDTDYNGPTRVETKLVKGSIVPKEVVELTGITNEMLDKHGVDKVNALDSVCDFIRSSDFIVAHNGLEYDKPLFLSECDSVGSAGVAKPWIDTMYDLPYPKHITERKLEYMCFQHGFMNPLSHRALADVVALQNIFTRYPIEEIIKINSTELLTIRADVSFEKKDRAAKRRYRWDPTNRIWVKKIRKWFLLEEIKAADFPVIVLG